MGILSFARSTSSHEDGSPAGDEGRITHLVTSSVQTGCLTSGARTATLPRSISREYSSTMQRMPFPHCNLAEVDLTRVFFDDAKNALPALHIGAIVGLCDGISPRSFGRRPREF